MKEPKITEEDIQLMLEAMTQPLPEFKKTWKKLFGKFSNSESLDLSDEEAEKMQQFLIDGALDLILKLKAKGQFE